MSFTLAEIAFSAVIARWLVEIFAILNEANFPLKQWIGVRYNKNSFFQYVRHFIGIVHVNKINSKKKNTMESNFCLLTDNMASNVKKIYAS